MSSTATLHHPVVILGAGINGAALARELVLNHVPVWLIDTADVAAGTTAYSSRLIHGGLRYLEYGEFDLVRESLAERTRLLRLSPQFVRPLRLTIPLSNRWGGLAVSAQHFLGLDRGSVAKSRGMWLVQLGLAMYDYYARDKSLPRHETASTEEYVASHGGPAIDAERYPWVCSYYDAQIAFPERFTLALVQDAREIAAAHGTEFRLFTYHRAMLNGRDLLVVPIDPDHPFDDLTETPGPSAVTEPALVVNATGAWVDETLAQLKIESPPLIAGTKGTHFFTTHSRLKTQLAGQAIYGEASDGRPVFILPLANGTLVGTTDEHYSGPPEDAVATDPELQYLLEMVNQILPDARLARDEIDWHYAGVRPLPSSHAATTGTTDVHVRRDWHSPPPQTDKDVRPTVSTSAITRRHFLVAVPGGEVPLFAIVGGKLTTCRSLAETATKQILERLQLPHVANSQERPLPGGEDYPDPAIVDRRIVTIAGEYQVPVEQVEAIWSLCGTRTAAIIAELRKSEAAGEGGTEGRWQNKELRTQTEVHTAAPPCTSDLANLRSAFTPSAPQRLNVSTSQRTIADTPFPRAFVRWVIEHEGPRTLEDLVERRLMLLYHAPPTDACLQDLAQLLVDAGLLPPEQLAAALQQTRTRLERHFGFRISEQADAEGQTSDRAASEGPPPARDGRRGTA